MRKNLRSNSQRELHSEAEDRIAMQLAVAESQQEMLQAAELKKERKTAGAGTGTQAPGTGTQAQRTGT